MPNDDDDEGTSYNSMTKIMSAMCCQASSLIDNAGPCTDDYSTLCKDSDEYDANAEVKIFGDDCSYEDINEDFCSSDGYYTCDGWNFQGSLSGFAFPPDCSSVSASVSQSVSQAGRQSVPPCKDFAVRNASSDFDEKSPCWFTI